MPKFTDGTWFVCKGADRDQFNVETDSTGNDYRPIAKLKGPDALANAQAIAVLPKLVAALEYCRQFSDDYLHPTLRKRIDAALALVEGK